MIGALLGTSALEDLAADAPPARVAVALSVMTGSMTGARRVQTVHCGRTHTLVSALRRNIKVAGLAAGAKEVPSAAAGGAAVSCTLQRLTVTAGHFYPPPLRRGRLGALLQGAGDILTA